MKSEGLNGLLHIANIMFSIGSAAKNIFFFSLSDVSELSIIWSGIMS